MPDRVGFVGVVQAEAVKLFGEGLPNIGVAGRGLLRFWARIRGGQIKVVSLGDELSITPEVGTIVRGRDIGRDDSSARRKFVRAQCPRYEEERWVWHDGAALQSGQRYCKRCVVVLQNEFRYGAKAYQA